MSWLKRKLLNWLTKEDDPWGAEPGGNFVLGSRKQRMNRTSTSQREVEIDSDRALNFVVYPAEGGTIIEFKTYDRQRDEHKNRLYIIAEEAEFNEALAYIISMERLRA